MLSRVADSLYWMSRYLERAGHTASVLSLQLQVALDQSPTAAMAGWLRLLSSLRVELPGEAMTDTSAALRLIGFDQTSPASIVSCVAAARFNARQVREQISGEMWEQINRLYIWTSSEDLDALASRNPQELFDRVQTTAHLFQGLSDSTMSRGQGWHFMQLGRAIERACNVSSLLAAHFAWLDQAPTATPTTEDYTEWAGLLRGSAAYEAYCKLNSAELRPERIVEFLLLNPDFPHAVRFSLQVMNDALQSLELEATGVKVRHRSSGGGGGAPRIGEARRIVGRALASLSFSDLDEIMQQGLTRVVLDVRKSCEDVHFAVSRQYISYPIDFSVLAPASLTPASSTS